MTGQEVKKWFESKVTTLNGKVEHEDFNGGTVIRLMTELVNSSNVIPDVRERFTTELRDKYFNECTDTSNNSGKDAGVRKINLTAHDLFEWFKSNAR